ncbi:helix-turn-helix domain-containing protein [Roseateles terrae]|uniref:Transcriptional regulator GlxA family with amidase domain n=1 Tax=Roseateles terrae TaxID=431060 RepID=A0ABR6GX40_9BURK|nr:helix-turn-helix domain-containing protein [Roseateles terrae]MBB3196673.1 transcriptional regulator GlxA family with amidase domain [Roseateles terrae]OWQ84919.1 AraC family transcriptional regulator [Roseateles terrae]
MSSSPSVQARIRVAVIAFDGISPFHLAIPGVVFGESLTDANPFELRLLRADPEPLRTRAGYSITGLKSLNALKDIDIVVVPSWRDVDERPPERLLRALRKAHADGAYVVGLCLGAHVLAEAGLLEGRTATTHWQYAQDMAARFPAVTVNADVLYIESDRVMTSAGTAAGLDACLQIVRQRLGSDRANQAARRLVIPPHREGGQAQFIEQPVPAREGGSRLTGLFDSVRSRLHEAHDVDSLAAEAFMSRRSFTRQFKALTGTTVLKWLLTERLQFAQQLLERSDRSIEEVGTLAGFGSAESLRLHFRRAFRTTPTEWRRRFRHQPAQSL